MYQDSMMIKLTDFLSVVLKIDKIWYKKLLNIKLILRLEPSIITQSGYIINDNLAISIGLYNILCFSGYTGCYLGFLTSYNQTYT